MDWWFISQCVLAGIAFTSSVLATFLMAAVRRVEMKSTCGKGTLVVFGLALLLPIGVAAWQWEFVLQQPLVLVAVSMWVVFVYWSLGFVVLDANLWPAFKKTNLEGKVAVVTGGSRGIGWWTALALAQRNATVVLASRSLERTNAAAQRINKAVGANRASAVSLDLSSLDSVRACARVLLQKYPKIHVLVNNGGFVPMPDVKTKQGYESGLGSMHFGHFLLTHLLEQRLITTGVESDPARVVYVSSEGHRVGRFKRSLLSGDGEGDLRCESVNGGLPAYGRAKLANILHTIELTRRFKRKGIKTVVCHSCHPGAVATDIWSAVPAPMRIFVDPLTAIIMRQPVDAGKMVAGMCGDPEWGTGTGWYAQSVLRPLKSSRASRDPKYAAALWAVSEVAVGLVPAGNDHVTKVLAAMGHSSEKKHN